jgi:Zn-dependent M16 (insulinase) family peptidase
LKFKNRFCQTKIFEDLRNEKEAYWLGLIDKYILNSFCVTVIGKPSEELMKTLAEQDKKRVDERKKTLGKKGLKELQQIVDNAQAKNDVYLHYDILRYELFLSLNLPFFQGFRSS